MVRMQVRLTEDQVRQLKELAAERGVSVSALVRQAVDALLAWEKRRQRAMSVVGKFNSGLTDVSERHDDYLAEAFLDWSTTKSEDSDSVD